MAEFALVLPILAFLLFAVVQFGIVFNQYITLTDATRAGARKGAVSRHLGNPALEAQRAAQRAATDLDPAKLNVAVTVNPSWTNGAEVTVAADYPYQISLFGLVVKSGRMHSTTKERVE